MNTLIETAPHRPLPPIPATPAAGAAGASAALWRLSARRVAGATLRWSIHLTQPAAMRPGPSAGVASVVVRFHMADGAVL